MCHTSGLDSVTPHPHHIVQCGQALDERPMYWNRGCGWNQVHQLGSNWRATVISRLITLFECIIVVVLLIAVTAYAILVERFREDHDDAHVTPFDYTVLVRGFPPVRLLSISVQNNRPLLVYQQLTNLTTVTRTRNQQKFESIFQRCTTCRKNPWNIRSMA